jgi:2-keto-4-pentenoate hydratase/2-oxohepta-3-ene-1,7-dioic acid hydratase in catechol pathway
MKRSVMVPALSRAYRSVLVGLIGLGATMAVHAAAPAPSQPGFKLGTFEVQGRTFVGVVLKDSVIVDLPAAHAAIRAPASAVTAPADMKDLIARYEAGLRERILQIVALVNSTPPTQRLPYVYDLKELRVRPPIMYPSKLLNTAVNYRAHAAETQGVRDAGVPLNNEPGTAPPGTKSATAIWERQPDDRRWNPYMFLKSPSAIIADGETILLPPGRKMVDWECELGVVIGRQASRVPLAQAANHIFGYTLQNDVSDREGRGDTRYGSDWLMGKSHDTFAPLGPFIVPKEFVPNPQNLTIRFSLNGQVMQEDSTSLMIHSVFEQVVYASHILTLQVGDVLATGTPGGVGNARTPPVFFKDGDLSVCTYEGIGTLTNPVKAL